MSDNKALQPAEQDYSQLLGGISELLEEARKTTVRSVNSIMTATYWDIGRRIVETEQAGEERAEYGKALLQQLAKDLKKRFGRGFSAQNLRRMRQFYLGYPLNEKRPTVSSVFRNHLILQQFPLPWSHYVRLLTIDDLNAREFYEQEAIRGGWSARQLDRQIGSQFYQRVLLSKNKAAMLEKAENGVPLKNWTHS